MGIRYLKTVYLEPSNISRSFLPPHLCSFSGSVSVVYPFHTNVSALPQAADISWALHLATQRCRSVIIQSIMSAIVKNSRGNSRHHFLHKEEIRELSHAFLTCSMHKERKVLVSDTQVKPSKTLKVMETSYKFSVRSWWKMHTTEVTLQGKDSPIPLPSGADSQNTLGHAEKSLGCF